MRYEPDVSWQAPSGLSFAPGSKGSGALSSDGGDCSHRAASAPNAEGAVHPAAVGGTNALTAPVMAKKSRQALEARAAAFAALPGIVAMLRAPLLAKRMAA